MVESDTKIEIFETPSQNQPLPQSVSMTISESNPYSHPSAVNKIKQVESLPKADSWGKFSDLQDDTDRMIKGSKEATDENIKPSDDDGYSDDFVAIEEDRMNLCDQEPIMSGSDLDELISNTFEAEPTKDAYLSNS